MGIKNCHALSLVKIPDTDLPVFAPRRKTKSIRVYGIVTIDEFHLIAIVVRTFSRPPPFLIVQSTAISGVIWNGSFKETKRRYHTTVSMERVGSISSPY